MATQKRLARYEHAIKHQYRQDGVYLFRPQGAYLNRQQ